MKKLLLLLMSLMVFNLSFSAKKTSADTTFTFQNFVPSSADGVRVIEKITTTGNYPYFMASNPDITSNMNKSVENFLKEYKNTKTKSYRISYELTANNAYFASALFKILEKDSKDGTSKIIYDGISFNLKNGKPLQLSDLFVPNYESELNRVINQRFTEFGLTPVTAKGKFEGVSKKHNFYMEDEALVLIYNQGEATDFADGHLFIPFVLRDLVGVIK
nr:DUF3298 domain-containing protein [uncultured Leptotrichia sp.]